MWPNSERRAVEMTVPCCAVSDIGRCNIQCAVLFDIEALYKFPAARMTFEGPEVPHRSCGLIEQHKTPISIL